MGRSAGTVPGILGLVWLRFRFHTGPKTKIPSTFSEPLHLSRVQGNFVFVLGSLPPGVQGERLDGHVPAEIVFFVEPFRSGSGG